MQGSLCWLMSTKIKFKLLVVDKPPSSQGKLPGNAVTMPSTGRHIDCCPFSGTYEHIRIIFLASTQTPVSVVLVYTTDIRGD